MTMTKVDAYDGQMLHNVLNSNVFITGWCVRDGNEERKSCSGGAQAQMPKGRKMAMLIFFLIVCVCVCDCICSYAVHGTYVVCCMFISVVWW